MCARTDRAPLTIGRTASWVSRESSTISAGFAPGEGWFGYALGDSRVARWGVGRQSQG